MVSFEISIRFGCLRVCALQALLKKEYVVSKVQRFLHMTTQTKRLACQLGMACPLLMPVLSGS